MSDRGTGGVSAQTVRGGRVPDGAIVDFHSPHWEGFGALNMMSEPRKARLKDLDTVLRSDEGLRIEMAAKRWGIKGVTISLDLVHLKNSVGPSVFTRRGPNVIYRYADQAGAISIEQSESLGAAVRIAIAKQRKRLAVLQTITQAIERLRKTDAVGAQWVLDLLTE